MRAREKTTLHFDLSHCPQDVEFTLQAGGSKNPVLTAYRDAPGKFDEHARRNKALALIPEDQRSRITHFVEGAEMYANALSVRRVVYPSRDDHPLPELALVFVHIPQRHVRQAVREGSLPSRHACKVLSHYGVGGYDALEEKALDEIRIGEASIKPPFATAESIVFHHPEIGTVNPVTAKNVLDTHVKNTQAFQELITYIQDHGPESAEAWYEKTYATWVNPDTGEEEPIPANQDLTYKNGEKATWPTTKVNGKDTPVIPQYSLTDEFNATDTGVIGAAKNVVREVLVSTKNDESLNGQLWTKQDGVTAREQSDVPPEPMVAAPESVDLVQRPFGALDAGANGFAIKNVTSSYGLYLYDDELKYDASTRTLSFPVKNWPSRYLGAYVQLLKSDGSPIKRSDIPGWNDSMPEFLRPVFEPSDSKNYLDWISSGNAVFGVPVPPLTQQTDISFIFPEAATSADVLLGGLGVAEGFKDWDPDVDVVGVLGTCLVNYGVSALSLTLTVYIVNPFISGLKGDAKFAFYAVCGVIGASALAIGAIEHGTSTGKYILSKLAGTAASIIFGIAVQKILEQAYKTAIEEIIAETVAEITAEEALGEIPYAGWALKVASVAADIAALAATTIECVLSPATYNLQILHTMNLQVTVNPDPAHGKSGAKPNWPLVADHYVIQVRYPKGNGKDGGTTFTKAGPMPGPPHNQPIDVTFEHIPAGGKVEVIASVYSENNWLAGQWQSGWVNADPNPDTNLLAVSGNIKENLVPLTPETTYSQKQTVGYSDTKEHHWQVTKFSIVDKLATDLDKGGDPDAAVRQAFDDNGNVLSANSSIAVVAAGDEWNVTDNDAGVTFHVERKVIYSGDGETLYELEVQNVTHPGPTLPPVIADCANDGHRLCDRVNLTINNKEYMLGYAWRASGQNFPLDYGTEPENVQMYAFQAISTLGQPQDYIVEPSRGFTARSYIAFDQFGLTPLFDLDPAKWEAALNAGGAVPADLVKLFGEFAIVLPEGAQITVLTKDKDWQIGLPGEDPLYELQLVSVIKDAQSQNVIGVYSAPVPKLDNFYLDSRTYTPENKLYYLRGVEFPKGASTFDYESEKSWGAFTDITINDMAVHPQGFVLAVDYDNHKLLTLRLPAEAVDDANAPLAMPLSGEGLREGLMNKPVALTVTADGRILVLEEGNQRIQAFDIKGNPVPSFSVCQPSFDVGGQFVVELDGREASTALVEEFQRNVKPALAPLFQAEMSSIAGLDSGQVDTALLDAFVRGGYAKQDQTPSDFTVTITEAGKLWLVTDTTTHAVFDLRVLPDKYAAPHLYVFRAFTLGVSINAAGREWTIQDTTNALTFSIVKPVKKEDLTVQLLSSIMPLRDQGTKGISYLDVAVETKGYIYVLSSLTADGSTDYRLDLYNPDGTSLRPADVPSQSGINAAKLTVDQWRSLFTLNFDKFLGPGQRTEPGISQWEPSTPGKPTSTI